MKSNETRTRTAPPPVSIPLNGVGPGAFSPRAYVEAREMQRAKRRA